MKWQRPKFLAALVAVALVSLFAVTLLSRGDEDSFEQRLEWAKTHTGGAGLASIAKGGDPDGGDNQQAVVGNKGDKERTPVSAEEEAYANRAYPETEIPVFLTQAAQAAFNEAKGRAVGRRVTGEWSLLGPQKAQMPGVLTFRGADEVTSGRVTAMVIDTTCKPNGCRLWVAAAGGGVWRTDNALSGSPTWKFISESFATNAIGSLTLANGVLYAGTGEPNASGDSEAGLGIYKSTDGGDTWTHLASAVTALTTPGNGTYTGDAFAGRSISSIVVDPTNPNVLYVGSARGVRGVSSVTGGATSNPPLARPPFGLFKSTDGGATFTFLWNGDASIRGVNKVELDPSTLTTIYAAAFQKGVWRSTDGGTTWGQIRPALVPAETTDRAEFAVTRLSNGKSRMYIGDGSTGSPASTFYRSDDVATGSPSWTNLTTYATSNYCTGQCWYDNGVYTPPGKPDEVYLYGSFQYGEFGGVSNGRAVLYSTNAGVAFTDMTADASSDTTPHSIHPDQHSIVTVPGDSKTFFNGSDGGVVRSSGAFTDISYQCASRGLSATSLVRCQQLLSRVPSKLFSLNKGLSTLQFQSLSMNGAGGLMGGTQDNGTYEFGGSAIVWPQIMYGDGGQSGYNAANPALRFNSFFGQNHDANFQNGDPTKWVIISGPIASSPEGSNFYAPIIADPNPASAGTIFEGSNSIWRTQDWGGNQAFLEANCPEFTTSGSNPVCGDFVRIGPAGATSLTAAALGTRAGGRVAAVERAATDTGTLWAATNTGRVFISKNADAAAGAVTFTRLDTLSSAAPGRFVSSMAIDPANPNHAWVSYSGYNFNTSAQPGHVFSVTYSPVGPTATWADLSNNLGDLPVTDLVLDSTTGDLYAASDFGVMKLEFNTPSWVSAGPGMPMVEVAGLTIDSASRKLYAATHGRGAWILPLP